MSLLPCLLLASGSIAFASAAVDSVAERLRARLETPGGIVTAGGDGVLASTTLRHFYQSRMFAPVWTDGERMRASAARALHEIHLAEDHGLRSEDYHSDRLGALLGAAASGEQRRDRQGLLLDAELLLTDALLLYASHLLEGRVDPTTFDAEWHVPPSRRSDVIATLERGISSGNIGDVFEELHPKNSGYDRLREARTRYAEIGPETWTQIPTGPKLTLGVEDDRVSTVRERLSVLGDMDPTAPAGERTAFDSRLEEAVVRFQRRHGLDADGVVGPATIDALNVTIPERTQQMAINLERWRWLPEDLGPQHILVNIPSFELKLVEFGTPALEMRVVVGKPFRRTPVFSGSMTYLVLSPYWHIPPSIATQDILPTLRKDPDYLQNKSIRVFRGWGAEGEAIDPSTIDWTQVERRNFPFRFRQDPGPLNALGGVKFMFPNPHNVYLHDTPSRELFARPDRTFSSGCIRLEAPLDLAAHLLMRHPAWTRGEIVKAIEKREETTVRLPQPIPVHLQYWTSWVDRDGTVHFRRDVYGRDVLLVRALEQTAELQTNGRTLQ